MIDSLPRRYIFSVILLVYCYILFSVYAYHADIIDYIILNIILYLLWYYFMSSRSFKVTYEFLDKNYHGHEELDWGYESYDGILDKIYVRIGFEDDWRELEDGLLYHSGIDGIKKYNQIRSSYLTAKQLESELKFKLTYHKERLTYKANLSQYRWRKWISFVILTLISYLFWVVYLGVY